VASKYRDADPPGAVSTLAWARTRAAAACTQEGSPARGLPLSLAKIDFHGSGQAIVTPSITPAVANISTSERSWLSPTSAQGDATAERGASRNSRLTLSPSSRSVIFITFSAPQQHKTIPNCCNCDQQIEFNIRQSNMFLLDQERSS
jgi:hypothetical protein